MLDQLREVDVDELNNIVGFSGPEDNDDEEEEEEEEEEDEDSED
jgi:hypothetical protein